MTIYVQDFGGFARILQYVRVYEHDTGVRRLRKHAM